MARLGLRRAWERVADLWASADRDVRGNYCVSFDGLVSYGICDTSRWMCEHDEISESTFYRAMLMMSEHRGRRPDHALEYWWTKGWQGRAARVRFARKMAGLV